MASERIIDTLEFFTYNLPMPKISSADRLLVAVHDMTDALKYPHRDVQFATTGYYTIAALAQLATISKNKFQKPLPTEISKVQIKAAENKQPAALIQQILTLPMKNNNQTISQNQVSPTAPTNVIESQNSPQLPRVVITAEKNATPPRLSTRVFNISPRNLSQDDFLDMRSVSQAIALGKNN
jgi:hypothetical protein